MLTGRYFPRLNIWDASTYPVVYPAYGPFEGKWRLPRGCRGTEML